MSHPRGPAVGIDKMNVAQVPASLPHRRSEVGFLDVHVKQVGQQADIVGLQGLQQLHALPQRVDQVRLVTVQRLVNQGDPILGSPGTQFIERITQIAPPRRLIDTTCVPALHRADNCKGAEICSHIDHRPDEIPRRGSTPRIRIAELQLVDQPTCACPQRRQLQLQLVQQLFERLGVERVGSGGEQFDGVETDRLRLAAAAFQVVPEHKRPAPRRVDQTDGHTGGNHDTCRPLRQGLPTNSNHFPSAAQSRRTPIDNNRLANSCWSAV